MKQKKLSSGKDHLEKIGRALIPRPWKEDLKSYSRTAGYDEVPYGLFGFVFYLSLMLSIALLRYQQEKVLAYVQGYGTFLSIIVYTSIFVALALITMALLMLLHKMYMDFTIYQRKKNVEEFLPDLLQQTSANIRAGMTIDRALWFATRPKFGILAKEIETVAKKTMSGVDFNQALREFAERYDSVTLKRSMNLLINGINAGGETGNLINKISLNIQDNKLMRKELAANLQTYVIFISFATIIAAPLLFAMSYNLLQVVQKIMGSITIPKGVGMAMAIDISGQGIKLSDFQVFAVASLVITSTFSALIISMIQKGTLKDSIRYIPVFIIATLLIYFVAARMFYIFVGVVG